MKTLRAVGRNLLGYGVFLPLTLVGIGVQAAIAGPIFKDKTTIPNLIYKSACALLGTKYRFNAASKPIVSDRPVQFISNHLSRTDFGLLPLLPKASPMMNAKFKKMKGVGPLVSAAVNAFGVVATEQSQDGKGKDLSKMSATMEEGRNTFTCSEGVQTDGRDVLRYSKGSAEIYFDEAYKDTEALSRAVIQPIAIRVAEINGEDVLNSPEKWEPYTLAYSNRGLLSNILRRTLTGSIVVDVTVLDAIDPKDFDNAADLMNEAHRRTRAVVAPGKTDAPMTRKEWNEYLDSRLAEIALGQPE